MGKRLPPGEIRVLIVDADGRLWSQVRAIEEGGIALSGVGCDYSTVATAVAGQAPDVVVIDFAPGGAALDAIERVMDEHPTPVLVVHGPRVDGADAQRALDVGALELQARPEPTDASWWRALAPRLRLLSSVRVVRHVAAGRRRRITMRAKSESIPFPVIAIAASLGGPKALAQVVRRLPPDFGAPILVCQHISDGFTSGLAQWLAAETRLRVLEPIDGEPVVPGSVYIAPSGVHLELGHGLRIHLSDAPPVAGFKPSCDRLLQSVAEMCGPRAIGVVLTGMGRDGARGLQAIHGAGGQTVAQDEASSIVFGMPREAILMGAAQHVVPLDQIAALLSKWVTP